MAKYNLTYKNGEMCLQETGRNTLRNQVPLSERGKKEVCPLHVAARFCSQTLQPELGLGPVQAAE